MSKDGGGISRRQAVAGFGAISGGVALGGVGATAAAAERRRPCWPRVPPWAGTAGTALRPPSEAQARETAAIMRAKLLPFGYDVFTVDIQWYEPEASSYTYNATPVPAMDGYGRLIPAPNRFPSSADGSGFTRLAADVHAMGMKFRHPPDARHPPTGGEEEPADPRHPLPRRRYRRHVQHLHLEPGYVRRRHDEVRRAGYYDSVFALYASWGVDFVKMDDMSRPYDAHAPEIEAAHKAIRNSGRPIILSLSPGETPVIRGPHVRRFAQMWRISDDFWDEWSMLEAQFTRLENWTPYRGPGSWPDADMLPLGRLALGKREHQVHARRTAHVDDPVVDRTLAAHHGRRPALSRCADTGPADQSRGDRGQSGLDRQSAAFRRGRCTHLVRQARRCIARPLSGAVQHRRQSQGGRPGAPLSGLSGEVGVTDLWSGASLGKAKGRFAQMLPPHGSGLYRLRVG